MLDGRRHWLQCVESSGAYRLDVLRAGQPYYDPPDLFSSPRMREFLDEAKRRYDVVMVDLPHVVGLPDVPALGAWLDGVLLLVDEERGPVRHVVERTVTDLESCAVDVLGLVRRGRGARRAAPRPRVAA